MLVDDSIWTSGSWTPTNILGHELGHTLGFRHEHTRPESGTCFEDNNWRPLTPYDSASIMHYPQCNGTSDDLELHQQRRQRGARPLRQLSLARSTALRHDEGPRGRLRLSCGSGFRRFARSNQVRLVSPRRRRA